MKLYVENEEVSSLAFESAFLSFFTFFSKFLFDLVLSPSVCTTEKLRTSKFELGNTWLESKKISNEKKKIAFFSIDIMYPLSIRKTQKHQKSSLNPNYILFDQQLTL